MRISPTPFCILDEVDAALDEANVDRFRDALRSLSGETQFILIAHNRRTLETANTIYGITMGDDGVSKVISLLSLGCPVPAAATAFQLDERTVKKWYQLAGEHYQAFHAEVVEMQTFDLGQVQADENKVKLQGFSIWMAMALAVRTRLWLGGVISQKRDKALIDQLALKVRLMAACRPLLLAVDGLASYPGAFQQAFRSALPRQGRGGRPRLVSWPDIAIVQVVKRRKADTLEIKRRIVQGGQELVERLLRQSQQGDGVINTAYIERLNATFRQRISHLARRTRHSARESATLTAGMYIVGCFYNFCSPHKSLRVKIWITERTWRWAQRTPAIAAGITDHIWTHAELLWFRIPPEPWSPPKKTRTTVQRDPQTHRKVVPMTPRLSVVLPHSDHYSI